MNKSIFQLINTINTHYLDTHCCIDNSRHCSTLWLLKWLHPALWNQRYLIFTSCTALEAEQSLEALFYIKDNNLSNTSYISGQFIGR